MDRVVRGFLALAFFLVGAVPAAAQPVADHLKCYKVKDPQTKATYTADLDGLVPQNCTVKVPAVMACVPTDKTNVMPTPPGGGGTGTPNSFFCYKVKCPKAMLPTLAGTDQFGSRTVTPSAAKLLCAPLAGPTTTTTTTTSSTTTTTTSMSGGNPLLATGQTTCWDSSGSVIPCAGTGQDGDLKKGTALAYVDNGDGTITDLNTGLVWEKQSQDGTVHDVTTTYGWSDAFVTHVATLNTSNFAGHNDWRVPNARELQSIVDDNTGAPAVSAVFNTGCAPGCTVFTCSCTANDYYWSSTTYYPFSNAARTIFFNDGTELGLTKISAARVRAVRGGS